MAKVKKKKEQPKPSTEPALETGHTPAVNPRFQTCPICGKPYNNPGRILLMEICFCP